VELDVPSHIVFWGPRLDLGEGAGDCQATRVRHPRKHGSLRVLLSPIATKHPKELPASRGFFHCSGQEPYDSCPLLRREDEKHRKDQYGNQHVPPSQAPGRQKLIDIVYLLRKWVGKIREDR
jgi:hypothetical protein